MCFSIVGTSSRKPCIVLKLFSVPVKVPSALGPLSPTQYMTSVLSRTPIASSESRSLPIWTSTCSTKPA